MSRYGAIVLCLVIFHRPDGHEIRIDSHVTAIQPAHTFEGHVASGIKTIIYSGGKNFGVIETPEQVEDSIRHCEDEEQDR